MRILAVLLTASAALQLMERAFAEPTLFRLAYSYEQGTLHRKPPPTTPPLRGESSDR